MAFSRYCALVAASLLGNALGCGSAPAAKSPSSGSEQEEREASGGAEAADEGVEGADDSAEAPVQSKPPKPGTQALDQRGLKMEFALTLMRGDAAAGVQTGNWSFDEERTHRVIESSDTAITKLQVVYGKWEAKPLLGLTYEVPTDGNSYMVTADGGVSVERSEGEALKSDEKAAVLAEYGWLGGPHPVVAAIERAGGQPDSELDAGSEFIYALVGAIPGVDHSKSTMNATFSGFADGPRKEAELKVSLKSELHSGPTVFALDLEGPARVDMTTGWTTSLVLKGAIGPGGQVKVKGKMLDVHGKGSATLKRVAQFK